ncbi:unnamed protein product [Cuscuta campestris]|uniref:Uncharacterized protein n=1 Tax=Cuscuta campestris TaxID=132261 RepID=A0A484M1R9_9ASTE|nr:unnamed protein product [Cuscuta campestris]
MGVCCAEDDGGGGHCGSGLGSHVGAGSVLVDFVGSARGGHVFRPLPTIVICAPVTYLYIHTFQVKFL